MTADRQRRREHCRPKAKGLKTEEPVQEDLSVIRVDPLLAPHHDHLKNRFYQYERRKTAIEKYEGGLEKFSLGFQKFGFNYEDGYIVYREWAPPAQAAQLVGDFNNWDGWKHQMKKDKYGVWSLRIPDVDGKPGIPHGSRVKFRMQRGDGQWIDRIPAWIKYASVEPGKMGAFYDGVYWNPPEEQRYKFEHLRPPKPTTPRIYEAHVGMTSRERCVASYIDFADNVYKKQSLY